MSCPRISWQVVYECRVEWYRTDAFIQSQAVEEEMVIEQANENHRPWKEQQNLQLDILLPWRWRQFIHLKHL